MNASIAALAAPTCFHTGVANASNLVFTGATGWSVLRLKHPGIWGQSKLITRDILSDTDFTTFNWTLSGTEFLGFDYKVSCQIPNETVRVNIYGAEGNLAKHRRFRTLGQSIWLG